MPCGLVPSPSVSSWTPLGPTRNSSGSKKSQTQISFFPQPHGPRASSIHWGFVAITQLLAFFKKGNQDYDISPPNHPSGTHGSQPEGVGKTVCLRIKGKQYGVSGRKGLWVLHHFLLPTPRGQKISSTYYI